MATEPLIISDGLDEYLKNSIQKITVDQQMEMPLHIWKRIRAKRAGGLRIDRLTFEQKVSILWKVFGKDVFLVVKEEEDGFLPEDFLANERERKHRKYGESETRSFIAEARLVLGTEAVCEAFHYRSILNSGRMYRYLAGIKGESKLSSGKKGMAQLAKMLIHYEANKKKMTKQTGLTISEWLILLYYADNLEKNGNPVYSGTYLDAHGASRAMLLRAFKRLSTDGLLTKKKVGKSEAHYKITTLGLDKLYTVFGNHILNY